MIGSRLATLCNMLEYCRPAGSKTETAFREKYLHSLPGATEDAHGNIHVKIGDTRVLWSSHTDTVHRREGRQTVTTDYQAIGLSRRSRKHSSCLGADDTVGVFLMREMILAGVNGHYVFHYGEEIGCQGSGDLAWHAPETVWHSEIAIALDRRGTSDIVNYQMCGRCASDEFCASLSHALHVANPLITLTPARGIYTDTAEYASIIAECTNLSVGYYDEHTSKEVIDHLYVGELLTALIALDQSTLIVARDPHAKEPTRTPAFTRIDGDARDYSLWNGNGWGIRAGKDARYVWRDETEDDWCYVCDAPIVKESDPLWGVYVQCVCTPVDTLTDDETDGLTDDDLKFLKYLKGLD